MASGSTTAAASSPSLDATLVKELSENGLTLRYLSSGDHAKGYFSLLSQLTASPAMDADAFSRQLSVMTSSGLIHTVVIEDNASGRLIASGTIVIEPKMTHGGGRVGHIEDIVTDAAHRSKRLGLRIIRQLEIIGDALGCYKIILDCNEKNVAFYEKCGFARAELQMSKRFPHNDAASH